MLIYAGESYIYGFIISINPSRYVVVTPLVFVQHIFGLWSSNQDYTHGSCLREQNLGKRVIKERLPYHLLIVLLRKNISHFLLYQSAHHLLRHVHGS